MWFVPTNLYLDCRGCAVKIIFLLPKIIKGSVVLEKLKSQFVSDISRGEKIQPA